jgi:hypothetical protein
MAAGKGHDKLTPEGKKFYEAIEQLNGMEVRIGFQAGEGVEDNGADIAEIAAYNELGTVHIPARPFLRDSVDAHVEDIRNFLYECLQLIVNGQATAQDILYRIGMFQKGLVQQEIVQGDFEPNKPATIEKKGSDVPLVDTGTMGESVNYVIVERGTMDD